MFKLRLLGIVMGAILAALCMATHARGQGGNQGSIEGTVVDQKGGAVSGATVTARNIATNTQATTATDSSGYFRLPVLLVGAYELTAEASGFSSITQKDIQLSVGSRLNLSLTLPVAGQQQMVEVSSDVPIVETTRSQVSATVDSQSVANLPVLGRNFINFVLLTPGVTLDTRGGDISFAGQRGTLNSLVIDGSDNNNTFFGQTTGRTGSGRAPYQFSQDAVAEFQVNSNSYSAEYGRAGGAVINVVTKSGTNDWHGTAFEFYRDTALNAQDSITKSQSRPKAPLHFNQFGGNLGGPVVHDKLFFFFDYDGQRNTLPNTVFLLLPRVFTPDATALNYLNARAQSFTRTQNQDVYLGKVDWRISQNHLLSGRINSQRFNGANLENGGAQNSLEHTGAGLVTTDSAALRLTSTLSSRLVNVASFSYLRDDEPGLANNSNAEATVRESGTPVLVVGRNFFSPRFTNIRRQQWGDTLSWVRGSHTFKFGADFIRDQIANFFPGNFSGSYNFASLASFGRNLRGQPQVNPGDATFTQAFAGPNTSGPTTNPNLFETAFFAQDEWRVRRSFTLNLGVRYDYQRVDQPSARNPDAFANGLDTQRIANPRNGLEPRIGFAWSPLSSNRFVVRAGYGIFYGRTPSIMYGTAMSNNGLNVATLTFTGPDVPMYPNNKCGAPGGPGTSPSCAPPVGGKSNPPTIFVFDKNYRQPFVQQWSLGLEHSLGRDFSVGVSYLGVRGAHLQRTRDINLGVLGTGTILVDNRDGSPLSRVTFPVYPAARPIGAFSRILQFEGSANSIYHGLILQFSKRMSAGVQFAAAYTFGKVIDDNPDATAVVPGTFDDAKMVEFPSIPGADRGPGQNDQRHRLVVSGIWNLDHYAHGMAGAPRFLLGGWELSSIFTMQSGQPYTATIFGDLNRDGNPRTDRFPGLGRDTFYLPRNITLDPRVTKDLQLREHMKFQLILEAFNVFNKNNVFAVNTTQYALACGGTCLQRSPTFGLQTSNSNTAFSPRILQLGAKFIF